ncbi:hypothetical protein DFJ58DRAFT_723115 [Suillus subalutaceus]|uniref:uncharacterized protein n=1 Tax=Suillus subalutaceus TaxID=48586 RepID=UPI001B8820CB|nr:uncharacterized protein DFJ58DRAFT_723115 [Suillus subalutaceus]KAG1870220.1 hypothetical protein DFJ58DRAFT_723115 [Suillus subalutaceus]
MRVGTKVTPCNLCALDWQANGHQREPVSSNLVLKPRPRPIPQQLPPTSIGSPPSQSHSAMIPPSNENTPVSVPEVQSNTDAVSLAVIVELIGTTHTEQTKTAIVVGDSKPNSIKKHQPSTKPMRVVSPKITARNLCALDWQSNGHQKEPATVFASYWNGLSKADKEIYKCKAAVQLKSAASGVSTTGDDAGADEE